MDSSSRIRKTIRNWYTRYLVSTELYMVEPWEKVVIHALFVAVFALFWYFNKVVILNGVSQARPGQLVDEL